MMCMWLCVFCPLGAWGWRVWMMTRLQHKGRFLSSFPYFGHCPTMTDLSSMWYWMFFCCCRHKSIICIWYETMRLIGFSHVSQAWSTPKVVNSEKSTRVQTYAWYEHFQMRCIWLWIFLVSFGGISYKQGRHCWALRGQHFASLVCSYVLAASNKLGGNATNWSRENHVILRPLFLKIFNIYQYLL